MRTFVYNNIYNKILKHIHWHHYSHHIIDFGKYNSLVLDDYIELKNIPTKLKNLKVNEEYGYKLYNKIEDNGIKYTSKFPSLEYLEVRNPCIEIKEFPSNLKYLILYNYNFQLNNLPKNLEILILDNYKYKLENLPLNLKILDLGNNYNIEIDNLPINLKELYISENFNKNIDNLPDSIEKLYIPSSYNQEIINYPNNLKKLIITNDSYVNNVYNNKFNFELLPNNLHILDLSGLKNINDKINKFPDNLHTLIFGQHYCNNLGDFDLDNLPNNLKKIKLPRYYNKPIDNLPDNIKFLKLGKYNKFTITKLPFELRVLHLRNYNQDIKEVIKNLIYLKKINFGNEYNFPIDVYPKYLKKIKFGYKYNHPFINIPQSIKKIYISIDYNQIIPEELDNKIYFNKCEYNKNLVYSTDEEEDIFDEED